MLYKNAPQIWGAHKSPGILTRMQTLKTIFLGWVLKPCNSDPLQGYADPPGLKTILWVAKAYSTLHKPSTNEGLVLVEI